MQANYTAPCHSAKTESQVAMCLSEVQTLADKLNAAYNAHHELEMAQGKPDADWPTFYAAYLLQNGVKI